MSNFEQLFGHEAVGAAVARNFGELGTFTGRVVKFVRGKANDKDLYAVEYEDGDVEDMDTEEYNFAYALHLRREGWDLEEDLEGNSDASGDLEGTNTNWRPSKVSLQTCCKLCSFCCLWNIAILFQNDHFHSVFFCAGRQRDLEVDSDDDNIDDTTKKHLKKTKISQVCVLKNTLY